MIKPSAVIPASDLRNPMKKLILLLSILAIGFTNVNAQDGATLYTTYCAGCHGADLKGNTATSLIKDDWVYGRTRSSIIRNVRFGIPGTEMIAWKDVLGDDGVRAVVDFIVESQTNPPSAKKAFPPTLTSEDYKLKVEVVGEGEIKTPWGIEFVDEKRALLTEQPGQLRWMIDGKIDPKPIEGLPKIHLTTWVLGGLMDIALDPDYGNNGWVYLAYSHTIEEFGDLNSLAMTNVVRGKIRDYQWTDQQILFQVPDSLMVRGGTRWGCRLLFDKEGYLYFTIGDMNQGENSQNTGSAVGKSFRIHPDGSVPKDNPFLGIPGALPQLFTIGNRNIQGMALHPETGDIWATEHGPMGGDELNILKPGANYGWPVITYGKDYDGSTVSAKTHQEGMEQPVYQWTPSIAVCPLEFGTGSLFPAWENDLFAGALAYEEVRRLVIEDNKVVKQEMILKNYGRIRDVKFGKDGALYVLVNGPDAILRITPTSGR